MLIIALVLAVIGLAALVFAVVTSNALVAWVCIGASVLGVLLLIIDALTERHDRASGSAEPSGEPEPASAEPAAEAELAPTTDDETGTPTAVETVNGADEHLDAEDPRESDGAEVPDQPDAAAHDTQDEESVEHDADQATADATVSGGRRRPWSAWPVVRGPRRR
jgi:hypothetical protein